MSVIFTKESEDLFVVNLEGVFTFNDLKQVESRVSSEVDRSRKVKVLVLAEVFSGWGKEGDWGDLKFMYEYDPYIEKIAIVGDAKWRDLSYAFTGKWLRPIPIEYFEADQEAAARQWLDNT
jgi:hypothetical protein